MSGQIPLDITDLKVFVKAAGVYGSAVDVPGVQELSKNTEMTSDNAWGDGGIVGIIPTERTMSGSIVVQYFTPAAFAAMTGGSVVTGGTGPTAVTHYIESSKLVIPYVQIVGLVQTASEDGGVTIVTILQAKINNGPEATYNRDVPTYSFDFDAMTVADSFAVTSQWADPTKTISATAMTALPTAA